MKEHVSRALTQVGKGRYKLGAGGMIPSAPTPFNLSGECDCSGFVCWALGISRHTTHPLYVAFNSGWINTDAIVHDASMPTGFFYEVKYPLPGDLIVFPHLKKKGVGHVGIVLPKHMVVHCSKGNMNVYGHAVERTGDEVFEGHAGLIYARYAGQ